MSAGAATASQYCSHDMEVPPQLTNAIYQPLKPSFSSPVKLLAAKTSICLSKIMAAKTQLWLTSEVTGR